MPDIATRDTDGDVVSFVPFRLGAPEPVPWPQELHPYIQLAFNWQSRGRHARFWEISGVEQDRMYEIAALMASVGEVLALLISAEKEYLSWEQVRSNDQVEALSAEAAKRVMAEIMVHYLTAAAHGLINLTFRTLALDRTLTANLASAKCLFPPLSEDRDHWPSANPKNVQIAKRVVEESRLPEIQLIVQPIAGLVLSDCWKALDTCRGEDFHRRRLQTAGVCGAGKASPWIRTDVGCSLEGFQSERIGVDVQAKLAAETYAIVSAARQAIVTALEEFDLRFTAVAASTTGLRLEPGATTVEAC